MICTRVIGVKNILKYAISIFIYSGTSLPFLKRLSENQDTSEIRRIDDISICSYKSSHYYKIYIYMEQIRSIFFIFLSFVTSNLTNGKCFNVEFWLSYIHPLFLIEPPNYDHNTIDTFHLQCTP